MLKVEFHCHTVFSKDSLTSPARLLAECEKKGIDRVVVTDHNSIQGALAAAKLDPSRVIVGEEIMTTAGELLAAFVQEEVPGGLKPLQAVQLLKDQGAFISVSHPFDVMRGAHWSEAELLEILPHIDAIEVFNSRCYSARFNQQALAFAQRQGIPGTAGSDAHAPFEIGRSYLMLPEFDSADSLRAVIGQAQMHTRLSSTLVHLTSRYAVLVKKYFPRHS